MAFSALAFLLLQASLVRVSIGSTATSITRRESFDAASKDEARALEIAADGEARKLARREIDSPPLPDDEVISKHALKEVGARKFARRENGASPGQDGFISREGQDGRISSEESIRVVRAADATNYSASTASVVNTPSEEIVTDLKPRPSINVGRSKVPIASFLMLVSVFVFLVFVFPVAVLGCFHDPLLAHAGVRPSKDGLSVFNYNPGKLSSGLGFLVVFVLPSMIKRGLLVQMLVFILLTGTYAFVAAGDKNLDKIVTEGCSSLAPLTTFVLGLYVSLALSKTYYANRSCFGTLFGRSLGFAQKLTSWVRAPNPNDAALVSNARKAQELLLRWCNAAYRLMVFEARGLDGDALETDLVSEASLLTPEEWAHVKALPSKCTHIYQWMNNVLVDLEKAGCLVGENPTQTRLAMHEDIEQMRGANVWGLPSLPIAYTIIIVIMVKLYLFFHALNAGVELAPSLKALNTWVAYEAILATTFEVTVQNLLFQGLVDLHGHLYNPNQGMNLGHLPVCNFLAFVKNVSEDLLRVNDSLPYTMDLHSALDSKPMPTLDKESTSRS